LNTVLRPFRFGVNCATTSTTDWLEGARKAESLGYATYIAQDHFGQQLAPLPALVAAAAVTSRLRLATVVLDNDFRHPATVAKEAATVDALSDGRFELGLGAGWLQSDYDKTGLPFEPAAVRVEKLAEAIAICKALFTSPEPVTFAGKHYQLAGLDTAPKPVQQPRPPIMLGGRQKRMLSLAAREADIVGISLLDRRAPDLPEPPSFAAKVDWVKQAAGPRFDQLELHVNTSAVEVTDTAQAAFEALAQRTGQSTTQLQQSPGVLVGSVEHIVDLLRERRERFGVSYYVVHARAMDAFGEVVARLAGS
jgi:probable F420-dependent oxidoreductase